MNERENLRQRFLDLKDERGFAELLGIQYGTQLIYHVRRVPGDKKYKTFDIPKRNGSARRISTPITPLKLIQQKLNVVLQQVYQPRHCVHGFTPDRNILTNATPHSRRRYVLNVDISDFFGSINFGRVRGLFLSPPYRLPHEIATLIGQICCHENHLPQGAPTSPIISNMICSKMDSELQRLAKKHKCYYTRYADDLTFSTAKKSFPDSLARFGDSEDGTTTLPGEELVMTIRDNGFELNPKKTRLQRRGCRQEVSGLVTNEFPNVRRKFVREIRAMIHAWDKFGTAAAQKRFEEKYCKKAVGPGKNIPDFERVLRGKLEFLKAIRGITNPVFTSLSHDFNRLAERPIELPPSGPLKVFEQAIWVLEDRRMTTQGTAFFLSGVGIVTCSHCVLDEDGNLITDLYVVNPREPAKQLPVSVKHYNAHIDLAILELDCDTPSVRPLRRPKTVLIQQQQPVTLVGYPNHAPGKSMHVDQGHITALKTVSGVKQFNISCNIVQGNSGGPVIDSKNLVVGVAFSGASSKERAAKTDNHGVIQIDQIENIKRE